VFASDGSAPALFGFIGRSGAGKTTLILDVIGALRARGYVVSAIKRAHDGVDLDVPGKDSFRMREAGCREVMVAGDRRFALLREYGEGEAEPSPLALAARLQGADIVLCEGFRSARIPTIEVYRPALGLPMLWPNHPQVVALATDGAVDCPLPRLRLDAAADVAAFICARLDGPAMRRARPS
jgi:molybdopterin-guanine dinucleotide biosynthesis protein B